MTSSRQWEPWTRDQLSSPWVIQPIKRSAQQRTPTHSLMLTAPPFLSFWLAKSVLFGFLWSLFNPFVSSSPRVDVFLPVAVHLVQWLWMMAASTPPDKGTTLTSSLVKEKSKWIFLIYISEHTYWGSINIHTLMNNHCLVFIDCFHSVGKDSKIKPVMYVLCRCGLGRGPEWSETHQWHCVLGGCQGLKSSLIISVGLLVNLSKFHLYLSPIVHVLVVIISSL